MGLPTLFPTCPAYIWTIERLHLHFALQFVFIKCVASLVVFVILCLFLLLLTPFHVYEAIHYYIPTAMSYSSTVHPFYIVSITNAGLMTSVDHLENLAVLKIYTFQGITTLGKAPYLNYHECASPGGCLCTIRESLPWLFIVK